MLDDITHDDRAFERHMVRASQTLLLCIERARAGLPTDAPESACLIPKSATPVSWTGEQIAIMQDMRGRGRTIGQISKAMNRSRGSIEAALRRYGVETGR